MNVAAASSQKTRISVYKIVVLGDGGVGKSGMYVILNRWLRSH